MPDVPGDFFPAPPAVTPEGADALERVAAVEGEDAAEGADALERAATVERDDTAEGEDTAEGVAEGPATVEREDALDGVGDQAHGQQDVLGGVRLT